MARHTEAMTWCALRLQDEIKAASEGAERPQGDSSQPTPIGLYPSHPVPAPWLSPASLVGHHHQVPQGSRDRATEEGRQLTRSQLLFFVFPEYAVK